MRQSAAKTSFPMQLVELKNGETYNGHMVQCDSWMNVRLREVICTSKVRHLGVCILESSSYLPREEHCLDCRPWGNARHLCATSKRYECMQDGDRFWRIPETYIRGNTIKYLRVPDEVGRVCLSVCLLAMMPALHSAAHPYACLP